MAAGVAFLVLAVVFGVRAGDRWLDAVPTWLGAAALGVLLVLAGLGFLRDLRRDRAGRRRVVAAGVVPHVPNPSQDIGWSGSGSSSDCGPTGGEAGGGGGDCGGGGGGS
ncbi:hypothetical protein [Micromonospora chersina]|uniref:hypothetical protein n=1 Tax=Micromonospora chersina TaxID=47854 RepID=UPI003716F64E